MAALKQALLQLANAERAIQTARFSKLEKENMVKVIFLLNCQIHKYELWWKNIGNQWIWLVFKNL